MVRKFETGHRPVSTKKHLLPFFFPDAKEAGIGFFAL